MQRLSGLDAAFLALETPSAHMHVIGVAVVDPSTSPEPWSHDTVRALLEARLPTLPVLRRRIVEVPFGVANPIWIDDPDFDLDFHLRRAALPAPGGPAELAAFVAEVAGRPLDRSRPLWEAWVVEGSRARSLRVRGQAAPLAHRRRVGRRDPRRALRPGRRRPAPLRGASARRGGLAGRARAERSRDARAWGCVDLRKPA